MFEHRTRPLLPRRDFIKRQARFAAIAAGMLLAALGVGALGYHFVESLNWLDAMYSAAMILTGMGPAGELKSDGGKWFATIYAIFGSLAFLISSSVLIAPLLHRMLHAMHLEGAAPGDDAPRDHRPGGPRSRNSR